VGLISKICVQNVFQTAINCGWNKTRFQPQYQTVKVKASTKGTSAIEI